MALRKSRRGIDRVGGIPGYAAAQWEIMVRDLLTPERRIRPFRGAASKALE
jgi:hypothetical protein